MEKIKTAGISKSIATRITAGDEYAYLDVLPSMDYILNKTGYSQEDAYETIKADAHVISTVGSRLAAVMDLEWSLTQGDTPKNQYQLYIDALKPDKINQLIKDIMRANGYGMQPIECIWQPYGNNWIINEFLAKPVRWFVFNSENKLKFLSKDNAFSGVDIPDHKILLPRNDPEHDNQYGQALYSSCYWPVFMKRNGVKWWNIFIEKYAMPTLIGELNPAQDEAKTDKLLEVLGEMVQDGIVLMQNSDKVRFLESNKTGEAYQRLYKTMNAEISKAWLGESGTEELGDSHAYAAVQTLKGIKDERRDMDKTMIIETIQTAINWMHEVNFSNTPPPIFVMHEPQGISKEQAEVDSYLYKTGVRFKKSHYFKHYKLDEEDFDIVDNEYTDDQNKPNTSFSRPTSEFKDQKIIDAAENELTGFNSQRQAETALEPVINVLKKAQSFEEAEALLLSTFPDMDTSNLEEVIFRAIFAAQSLGHFSAKDE